MRQSSQSQIVITLIAVAATIGLAATARFPSEVLSVQPPQFDARSTLRPCDDLRYLYVDRETLAGRKTRGNCAVDALETKWRKEISVGAAGFNLESVLLTAGVTNWHGQRQIRIVKRNAILQSDFPASGSKESSYWKMFLTNSVGPGDLVVVCTFD